MTALLLCCDRSLEALLILSLSFSFSRSFLRSSCWHCCLTCAKLLRATFSSSFVKLCLMLASCNCFWARLFGKKE